MTARHPHRPLREMLAHGTRPPVLTVPAAATASHVTGPLDAPRVPVEAMRDLSPMARLAVIATDLDPIAASCAVKLLEAYCELDANRKVLLMAVAQTFREADRG